MIKVQLSERDMGELREIVRQIKETAKSNLQLSIVRMRADVVLFRRSFTLWKRCPLPLLSYLQSPRLDKLGIKCGQRYNLSVGFPPAIGEREDQ